MTPSKEYIVPSKEGFYRKYCPESSLQLLFFIIFHRFAIHD